MADRIDCIKRNEYPDPNDPDLVIEGHNYQTFLALYDRDTDRTYIIDECEDCGKRQASWCPGKDLQTIKQYPAFVQVGGRDV